MVLVICIIASVVLLAVYLLPVFMGPKKPKVTASKEPWQPPIETSYRLDTYRPSTKGVRPAKFDPEHYPEDKLAMEGWVTTEKTEISVTSPIPSEEELKKAKRSAAAKKAAATRKANAAKKLGTKKIKKTKKR